SAQGPRAPPPHATPLPPRRPDLPPPPCRHTPPIGAVRAAVLPQAPQRHRQAAGHVPPRHPRGQAFVTPPPILVGERVVSLGGSRLRRPKDGTFERAIDLLRHAQPFRAIAAATPLQADAQIPPQRLLGRKAPRSVQQTNNVRPRTQPIPGNPWKRRPTSPCCANSTRRLPSRSSCSAASS